MPSSSENFEQSRSRSWDILAAAMGGGIALSVGLGINYAFKAHKLDRSNINAGTATGAGAGAAGTNSALPSWSYHQTFNNDRSGLNTDIPSLGRSRSFKPFIINDPKIASNPQKIAQYTSMAMDPALAGINSSYYIGGNITASQRTVKGKLQGFSWSTHAGGKSSGIVPFMSNEGTEGVLSYFNSNYSNPIFNDYKRRLSISKGKVVNAGNRKGVLPSMLLPNKAGGYSHHDPTLIFKRAFNVLNKLDSTNAYDVASSRVRAMMANENLTTNDIGKSITAMYNSLLRTPAYTEILTQRELSSAYNVIDGIKDHKLALNFFANAGILGNIDEGSADRMNFERFISPGNRKRLSNTGKGYVKFKTVTNPNELFTFTSLEARERLALAKSGVFPGLEKEEHQTMGFMSFNRMQDMPNSYGISQGMRVNEFMHARPFSGEAVGRAARARNKGFGVWMGETLQNQVRTSMKIAHGKSLANRNLAHSGNPMVDLALTTMTAIDFTPGGPLSEGAMFYGRKGAGEFTRASEFVRPSNINFKIGAGVSQAQITQNISSSTSVIDQIRSQLGLGLPVSDSYIADQFVSGNYNGKVNVKINEGDFFERVINEQEVRFQFNNGFNLTGMEYGAGEVSFQTHSFDNLTRVGSAISQGGRQHLENMGYIPKDMAKGLSRQTASILKRVDHNVFRPMAVSHASQMKSYDWLNYGVTQYLQTPELLGDTVESKLRRGKLQTHLDTFGIGAKVQRVNSTTGGLPGYHITNSEALSRGGVGKDGIGNFLRALRQDQGSYLERTGVTSSADKYKMFAIMSGSDSELNESLVDVNGRKMLIGSNTFESKTASTHITTGMGKAGMIGGSSSQKVNASHWNYADQHGASNLKRYIEDIMSNNRGGPWLGAIEMSHNENPSVLSSQGGLRGALENQLGSGKIGGLTELLANGGSSTDEISTVLGSTMLSPKDAQSLPNLSRLYESNKGYAVNIAEGLDSSVADHFKINMGDASLTKRPLSEVVITPFGGFSASGVDPQYNTFVGGADKAQLEFIRDLQVSRNLINTAAPSDKLRVAQNQAIAISNSYMKLTKAREALYTGKNGLINSPASGVRATLSGYQNILPNDQIVEHLNSFRSSSVNHGKYGTGLYTKGANGAFEAIDSRFIQIGSLDSIADSTKGAINQLGSAGIHEDVFTFQNGKYVKSGKTGMVMHKPHPGLAATVQGVSRYVGISSEQADKLGVQLPKGVLFTDPVHRFSGYRDTDFDHWSVYFFGDRHNKGVQEDLTNIYNNQKENWEYYDSLRKALRPEEGLEEVKIEGDLRFHDNQTELEALDSINKSSVQKRATGILDKSIENRRDLYNVLLKTPEQYAQHSAAAGVGGGLMQKYFPATERGLSGITSLMDSIIGSQKQVTISKGFGQNIFFSALNTFDDGLQHSTAGKIQNLTSQALLDMAMSVTTEEMDSSVESHAKAITSLLSQYATSQLESTEASNIAATFGYDPSAFQNLKNEASNLDWNDTAKTLKKSFHPVLQSQQTLINDIKSGGITSQQKKELVSAFGSFHQFINQTAGVSASSTDKIFSFQQIAEMFKTNVFPNGMSPTDALSALSNAPDISKEGELLKNTMMLGAIQESMSGQISEAGTIASKQVESMAAGNANLAATSKAGSFASDLFDIGKQTSDYFRWALDKTSDFGNLAEHVKRTDAIFDSAANFYKKRKGLFAVAGAVAAVGVASHVVGAMNGGDTNIQSAPLPPTTQLDDGAILETPQFNSSPGPPSVRVAREMGAINNTNATYNGENFGTDVIDELQGFSGVSTFVHDDRSSFNRQSMMSYKDEQSRSRF